MDAITIVRGTWRNSKLLKRGTVLHVPGDIPPVDARGLVERGRATEGGGASPDAAPAKAKAAGRTRGTGKAGKAKA